MREQCRDYWLFMYYCNGINVKDMCLLKYGAIQDDMLHFNRAKVSRTKRTTEPIRAVLLKQLQAIIKKHGNKNTGPDQYIFPVLQKGDTPERVYQLHQQLTKQINKHMRAIAQAVGINANVTTYVARHSYATVQKRAGVSMEMISEALGHTSFKTAKRYLANFETDKLKEAAAALTAFPQAGSQ